MKVFGVRIDWPKRRHKKTTCPLCGRRVAVTKNGLTWYHRVNPAGVNARHHTVNLHTGQEV